MNILIVDDHPTNLTLLRAQLEAEGHTVVDAATGIEALAVLLRNPIDAVISDILMPGMDGYQLCHEIREHPDWRSLPFIVYTATYTSPREEKLALSMGVDVYLRKPAPPAAVAAALDEVMRLPVQRHQGSKLAQPEAPVLREYNVALIHQLEETCAEATARSEPLQAAENQFHHPLKETGELSRALDESTIVATRADISERKAHEIEVERLSRLYAALSGVNQAIVRLPSRDELFRRVCQVLVEQGGFCMAWVGWHDPETHVLVRMADWGDGGGYLQRIKISGDDLPEGLGPTGKAFRTGHPFVCNDMLNDDATLPWRAEIERCGFCASAAFPFRMQGMVCGTLSVYSEEKGFFRDKEIALLTEAAADLSFALDNFAREAERQRGEQASRRLAAIVESSDDAIIGKDLSGIVTSWNTGAERLFGYTAAEMLGQPGLRLIPPERHDEETHVLETVKRGLGVTHFETVRQTKDGRLIDISVTTSPIVDAAGRVIGASKIARDIGERKRAEEASMRARERLNEAQRIGQIGDWDFDLATGLITWSPQVFEILGLDPSLGPPQNYEDAAALYEPASAALMTAKVAAAIASGEVQNYELVALRPGGQRVSVGVRVVPRKDGTGKVLALSGTVQDITDRKAAEAALRESEGKLRKVIDGLGPYMFVGLMTPDGVLIEANRPALEAAGLKSEDVLGKPFPDTYWWAWSEPVQAQLIVAIARAVAGVPSRYDVQMRLVEGTLIWVDFSLFPVHGPSGEVIFLVPSAIIIDERKKVESELRELAHRLLQAEDEERRRIARELHDSTAQDLVAALLNLGTLRDSLPDLDPEPAQILEDSVALLENSANDIRTLSYALHPPRLDERGLPGGLAEYAAGLGKRADVSIRVEAEADFGRFPENIEYALFRVAQESLSNVVRHSQSTTATLCLARKSASIVLEIEDRGSGLPPDLATRTGAHGVGIAGMRERLQHLGGRLEITSGDGRTVVRAVLPWNGAGK